MAVHAMPPAYVHVLATLRGIYVLLAQGSAMTCLLIAGAGIAHGAGNSRDPLLSDSLTKEHAADQTR